MVRCPACYRMKSTFFRPIWALCLVGLFVSNSFAVDFQDCQDRMERLSREARDADMNVANPQDVRAAINVLDSVQTAIERARRACGHTPVSSFCGDVQAYALRVGKQTALEQCKATQFESVAPGYCSICLGMK